MRGGKQELKFIHGHSLKRASSFKDDKTVFEG